MSPQGQRRLRVRREVLAELRPGVLEGIAGGSLDGACIPQINRSLVETCVPTRNGCVDIAATLVQTCFVPTRDTCMDSLCVCSGGC